MPKCKLGLEVFAADSFRDHKSWGKCGLLSNHASLDIQFRPAWELAYKKLGARLTTLFGPQHGFDGIVQDNMIETAHGRHRHTGLPVFSLYSETREPTEQMFANIDTLLVDLQHTGCRVYTWKATLINCLRAAKRFSKRVIVLDRPNPLGGVLVEGMMLTQDAESFVGQAKVPMRHALTLGEIGVLANKEIGAEYSVVKLENWQPESLWSDLGRYWVLTSPNLPTFDSVAVYAGTVIFEGCNVSEGRGTTLPFQYIGAGYIGDADQYCRRVKELIGGEAPGLFMRACGFQPTFHKFAGVECRGVHLIPTAPEKIVSWNVSLALMRAAFELSNGQFAWKDTPYEYDFVRNPFDLICGKLGAAERMTAKSFNVADDFWHFGIAEFCLSVQPHLLYARQLRPAFKP